MPERLPSDYFDRLAYAAWQLGRAGMTHLIEIAPVPSMVKGSFFHDGVYIEPAFEIRHEMPQALEIQPRTMVITISDSETYVLDEAFTMYTYRRLTLDTSRKKREYDTGVLICDDEDNMITPQLQLPAPGVARRPGNAEWRNVLQGSNIAAFDRLEADSFLQTIYEFTDRILQQS